jgi:hypothetical protein
VKCLDLERANVYCADAFHHTCGPRLSIRGDGERRVAAVPGKRRYPTKVGMEDESDSRWRSTRMAVVNVSEQDVDGHRRWAALLGACSLALCAPRYVSGRPHGISACSKVGDGIWHLAICPCHLYPSSSMQHQSRTVGVGSEPITPCLSLPFK